MDVSWSRHRDILPAQRDVSKVQQQVADGTAIVIKEVVDTRDFADQAKQPVARLYGRKSCAARHGNSVPGVSQCIIRLWAQYAATTVCGCTARRCAANSAL